MHNPYIKTPIWITIIINSGILNMTMSKCTILKSRSIYIYIYNVHTIMKTDGIMTCVPDWLSSDAPQWHMGAGRLDPQHS